jgi:hypothetical protein
MIDLKRTGGGLKLIKKIIQYSNNKLWSKNSQKEQLKKQKNFSPHKK